jgi:hypothetical protein
MDRRRRDSRKRELHRDKRESCRVYVYYVERRERERERERGRGWTRERGS